MREVIFLGYCWRKERRFDKRRIKVRDNIPMISSNYSTCWYILRFALPLHMIGRLTGLYIYKAATVPLQRIGDTTTHPHIGWLWAFDENYRSNRKYAIKSRSLYPWYSAALGSQPPCIWIEFSTYQAGRLQLPRAKKNGQIIYIVEVRKAQKPTGVNSDGDTDLEAISAAKNSHLDITARQNPASNVCSNWLPDNRRSMI